MYKRILAGLCLVPSVLACSEGSAAKLLVERVAKAVVKAWKNRKPGSVTWGLGHAVVACNRRAAAANGSARMYGRTDTPDFRSLEGFGGHDVGTLFFWNTDGQLIAAGVNVSCPSRRL